METANLFAKYIAVMNGELDVHSGYMGKFHGTQEEIDRMKPSIDNLSCKGKRKRRGSRHAAP